MKRLNTGLIYAAVAGVIGLAVIGYQADHNQDATEGVFADVATSLSERLASLESIQERVIDLPEDGGLWYLTLVYPDAEGKADPISRRVKTHFTTDPRLASLITQTRFHKVYPGHQTYEYRTKKSFGLSDGQTAVILQQPDGTVCYKATGENIPTESNVLADSIAAAIADCRPRPTPQPTPQPVPDQTPDIPDTVTPDAATSEENLAGLLFAAAAAGIGGAYLAYRSES